MRDKKRRFKFNIINIVGLLSILSISPIIVTACGSNNISNNVNGGIVENKPNSNEQNKNDNTNDDENNPNKDNDESINNSDSTNKDEIDSTINIQSIQINLSNEYYDGEEILASAILTPNNVQNTDNISYTWFIEGSSTVINSTSASARFKADINDNGKRINVIARFNKNQQKSASAILVIKKNEPTISQSDISPLGVKLKFINSETDGVYNEGETAIIKAEIPNDANIENLPISYEWYRTEIVNYVATNVKLPFNTEKISLSNLKPNQSDFSDVDNIIRPIGDNIRVVVKYGTYQATAVKKLFVQKKQENTSDSLISMVNSEITRFGFKPKRKYFSRKELWMLEQSNLFSLFLNAPASIKQSIDSNNLFISDFNFKENYVLFRLNTKNGNRSIRATVVFNTDDLLNDIENVDLDGTIHSIPMNDILNATSPLEIIAKTRLFKETVKNVNKLIRNGNWGNQENQKLDFYEKLSSDDDENKFYKLNQEVGISGEYGNDIGEKMMFAPKGIQANYDMPQRYLRGFIDSASYQNYFVNIDSIILKNQFGYLPSNMSQMLFYMDYNSIKNIFGVKSNIIDINANVDDEKGELDILLTLKNGSINRYHYNQTNSVLKKNKDFRQYIYDRSFKLTWQGLVSAKMKKNSNIRLELKPQWLSGTSWIFDRIIKPNSKNNEKYEFLVGTNMHVLNISDAFNKDRALSTGTSIWSSNEFTNPSINEKIYNEHWDGGFFTKTYVGSDVPTNVKDEIVNQRYESKNNLYYEKFNNRNTKYTIKAMARKGISDDSDESEKAVLDTNIQTPEGQYVGTSLNNRNATEKAVWYTPTFETIGSYTDNDNRMIGPVFDRPKISTNPNDLSEGLTRWKGNRVGKISNAGGDFAVTKMEFTKDEIKILFPSLYKVLGTEQEKDWYMGMGANNGKNPVPSANSTLFVGGFPATDGHRQGWSTMKSIGGKIISQQRYLGPDKAGSVQSYWTKYNEEDNNKFNEYRGLVNWYKKWSKFPSFNDEDNKIFNPHGMQIQKVLQQSIITYSNNGWHDSESILYGGSSGAMIINSRFELIGVNFMGSWKENMDYSYFNVGMLFNNYTEYNKDYSIIKQIQDKLKNENLNSFRLNPKN